MQLNWRRKLNTVVMINKMITLKLNSETISENKFYSGLLLW